MKRRNFEKQLILSVASYLGFFVPFEVGSMFSSFRTQQEGMERAQVIELELSILSPNKLFVFFIKPHRDFFESVFNFYKWSKNIFGKWIKNISFISGSWVFTVRCFRTSAGVRHFEAPDQDKDNFFLQFSSQETQLRLNDVFSWSHNFYETTSTRSCEC